MDWALHKLRFSEPSAPALSGSFKPSWTGGVVKCSTNSYEVWHCLALRLEVSLSGEKLLFVCSQNRLRSPTAEQIFSRNQNIEVASAGTNNDAEIPVTVELIEWADVILVMERSHRNKLQKRFKAQLRSKRLICLDIPDDFEYMDPELIRILESRLPRFLPAGG